MKKLIAFGFNDVINDRNKTVESLISFREFMGEPETRTKEKLLKDLEEKPNFYSNNLSTRGAVNGLEKFEKAGYKPIIIVSEKNKNEKIKWCKQTLGILEEDIYTYEQLKRIEPTVTSLIDSDDNRLNDFFGSRMTFITGETTWDDICSAFRV